jgi:hypothetical protein
VWDGKTLGVPSWRAAGDASGMLDLLLVTLAALRAAGRSRGDLVLENLLLRHQLAVLTRPTRRRRARFRRLDKALWVLRRRVRRDWRRHLIVVTPRGVAPLLAVAVTRRRWPATAQPRDPGADRADGTRESVVGR